MSAHAPVKASPRPAVTTRPAQGTLAYYAAEREAPGAVALRKLSALDQMYGYYGADLAQV